jgi:hypothetical protein
LWGDYHITYVPTDEGWLYLAALKDLHTCEIVGWAMDSRMTQTLVTDALRAAYWRNKPKPGLLHHSDCGSQYCSHAYRALQASYGMQTSMSRKGNCWDNAPMESFFGTLKTESCITTVSLHGSKQGRPSLNTSRCFTIAFDGMQKLAIKYRPISLSGFTPTVKWRHNPSDLPVH